MRGRAGFGCVADQRRARPRRHAVDRFGHLDVLVNNAGSFQAGFFEEMTPEAFRSQIETTLFGPVNVTRAALPQMRAQRCGLVVTDLLDRRHRRRPVTS